MAKVRAEKPKATVRGTVRHIRIESAKNGVTVEHHRESGNHGMMGGPQEKPMVFEKMSKAHKHVKQLMQQMPFAGGGEDNSAEEMGEQEA